MTKSAFYVDVEEDLLTEFKHKCLDVKRKYNAVIEELMKDFIKKHENENPSSN